MQGLWETKRSGMKDLSREGRSEETAGSGGPFWKESEDLKVVKQDGENERNER